MITRLGLLALALPQAVLGGWAVAAPRSFYDGFPGGGRDWVASLGPYDKHLVIDVGALSLALVVVLVAAAWTLDRALVLTAAGAWLAWSLPHLAFHLGADHALSTTADRVASTGGQIVTVLIALALMIFALRKQEVPTA